MKYFEIIDKNVAAIFQLQWKIGNIFDVFLKYSVQCEYFGSNFLNNSRQFFFKFLRERKIATCNNVWSYHYKDTSLKFTLLFNEFTKTLKLDKMTHVVTRQGQWK